jgi:hypothetical protein
VREDGIIVGGDEQQPKVYNREEWKVMLDASRLVKVCAEVMGV